MSETGKLGLDVVQPEEEHVGEYALVRQMGNLQVDAWPDARILAIRQLFGSAAKNLAQLGVFMSIAANHGLDPALGEIWLIQTNKGPKAYSGRDGFLKSASRQPNMYSGIQSGVVYESDDFHIEVRGTEAIVHHKFNPVTRTGRPHGAYCIAYDGAGRPTYVYRVTAKCQQMKSFYWKDDTVDDAIHNRAIAAGLRRVVPLGGMMIAGEEPIGFDAERISDQVGKSTRQKLHDVSVELGIRDADPEVKVVEGKPVEEDIDAILAEKVAHFNIPLAAFVAWARECGSIPDEVDDWTVEHKTMALQAIVASDGLDMVKEWAKALVDKEPDLAERMELLTAIANTEERKVLDNLIERMLER